MGNEKFCFLVITGGILSILNQGVSVIFFSIHGALLPLVARLSC